MDRYKENGEDGTTMLREFGLRALQAGFPPERFEAWLSGEMGPIDLAAIEHVCSIPNEELIARRDEISARQWAKVGKKN